MPAKSSNDQDKLIAALAYVIFFLPLVLTPKSKLGHYHANQGLLLLAFSVLGHVLGTIFPIIGWFIILPIVWFMTIILFIMGVINALNGNSKPLPLIGQYELIK